jgi:hypothetical protein
VTTVIGTFLDYDGLPVVGAPVYITIVAPGPMLGQRVTLLTALTTNASGTWTSDLLPVSALFPAGSYYAISQGEAVIPFIVPDGSPSPRDVRDLVIYAPPPRGVGIRAAEVDQVAQTVLGVQEYVDNQIVGLSTVYEQIGSTISYDTDGCPLLVDTSGYGA